MTVLQETCARPAESPSARNLRARNILARGVRLNTCEVCVKQKKNIWCLADDSCFKFCQKLKSSID